MPMRAGQLDRRILIQTLTETRDGAGQPVKSWSDVGSRWAEVTPLEGGESFVAGEKQRRARKAKTFKIRYMAGLSPKATRVVYDGEAFDIEAVDEVDGRRVGLLLTGYAFEETSGA